MPAVSKGKGKQRAESSEVEIIEEPMVAKKKFKETSTTKSVSSSGPKSLGSHHTLAAIQTDEDISFGEPSSLLRFSSPCKLDIVQTESSFGTANDLLRPRRSSSPVASSAFGVPRLLLQDRAGADFESKSEPQNDVAMTETLYLSTENTAQPSRPSVHPIQGARSSFSSFSDASVIDLSDDEWAMGDDEMALVDPEPDNDDEDIETAEVISSDAVAPRSFREESEGITVCPVCGLHLVELLVPVSSRNLFAIAKLTVMWNIGDTGPHQHMPRLAIYLHSSFQDESSVIEYFIGL